MLPTISIVIPCYNSGEFLLEAIQSVEQYKGHHAYEIIIIDDGSTKDYTIELLNYLEKKNIYKILHKKNGGAASARNTGVYHAKSDYILFLDSDNKLNPDYIDKGVAILKNNPNVGVVYANATFFGEGTRDKFESGIFDIQLLLTGNYIDMCSVIRKSVWEQVGGLDESKEMLTYEDWEFWIRIYKSGWKFLYLDEILFYYRIREDSLMSDKSKNGYSEKIRYVYSKHSDLVYQQYLLAVTDSVIYKKDIRRPFRSFFKYLKIKYLKTK